MIGLDLSGAIQDAALALQADHGCRPHHRARSGYCASHDGRWVHEDADDPGYCLAARDDATVAVRAAVDAILAALHGPAAP